MSNLLREAIIDAEALRESALKNAETIVIEKYSSEVKQTLEKLLEQEDELGMPELPAEEAPAADPLDAGLEDPAMAAAVEPALEEAALAAAAPSNYARQQYKNMKTVLKTILESTVKFIANDQLIVIPHQSTTCTAAATPSSSSSIYQIPNTEHMAYRL